MENFDTKELEEILLESQKEVNEIREEGNELSTSNSALSTVDISSIYNNMNSLITTGNTVLDIAKYASEIAPGEPGFGEVLAGTSSLINSIKDVLKEFSKIYSDKISHERKVELEKLKIEGRKEIVREKAKYNNPLGNSTIDNEELIEYKQGDIVSEIIKQESENI